MAARYLYGTAYIGRYFNELGICVIFNEQNLSYFSPLCDL